MEKYLKINGCAVITSPSNLFYFTDYENADAVLVFFNEKGYYFTDSRCFEEVLKLFKNFEVKDITQLKDFFIVNNISEINVESSLRFDQYQTLCSFGINDFIIMEAKINSMRSKKFDYELERIVEAQKITDKTFEDILPHIKEGISEEELSSCLESLLYKNGADALAFTSIVAFGENTSKPHAHRSNKVLTKDTPILMDFGAKYKGYCSDMTRTLFFGKPDKNFLEIYDTVLSAQEIALKNIKCEMSGAECDALARSYFAKKGLDRFFTHSLGHSLGVDIHENPNFSPRCVDIIPQRAVLSVEPGLYFEGKYGIRIEDIIYFDKTGIINLTKSPKKLIIL